MIFTREKIFKKIIYSLNQKEFEEFVRVAQFEQKKKGFLGFLLLPLIGSLASFAGLIVLTVRVITLNPYANLVIPKYIVGLVLFVFCGIVTIIFIKDLLNKCVPFWNIEMFKKAYLTEGLAALGYFEQENYKNPETYPIYPFDIKIEYDKDCIKVNVFGSEKTYLYSELSWFMETEDMFILSFSKGSFSKTKEKIFDYKIQKYKWLLVKKEKLDESDVSAFRCILKSFEV